MNIRIKTAHGYLSFQPDGRLEYRDKAGLWENIEVEGLTFEPVPGPGPTPPPVDVGQPTAEYVGQVKARLQAAGVPLSGACGAFNITKQVAWDLQHLGYGLVSKPSGNNCEGYSTDYLCLQNGDGVDILGDAGGANTPQWGEKPGEFAGQDRWRKPVQP